MLGNLPVTSYGAQPFLGGIATIVLVYKCREKYNAELQLL